MLTSVLTTIPFTLLKIICWAIDRLTQLFEIFSGLTKVTYQGESTYLFSVFLNHSTITNVYWGMAIIGLVLCFVFAIAAVIRKMFDLNGRQQASLGQIIGDTLKTIILILGMNLIMTVALAGADVLLRQINYLFVNSEGLSRSESVEFTDDQYAAMGRALSTIGNYGMNPSYNSRYNVNDCFNTIRPDLLYLQEQGVFDYNYSALEGNSWQSVLQQVANAADLRYELKGDVYYENVAQALENALTVMRSDASFQPLASYEENRSMNASDVPLDRIVFLVGSLDAANNNFFNQDPSFTDALRLPYYTGEKSLYDTAETESIKAISKDFDLSIGRFDYLVSYVLGIALIYNTFTILLALIARMFNILFLYIIAPPVLAVRPLDGGGKAKQWMTAFIIQLLGVFGSIIVIRLLLIFIPIVFSPDLVLISGHSSLDYFAKAVILLAAYAVAKKAGALLSGILSDTAAMQSVQAGDMSATAQRAVGVARQVGGAALRTVGGAIGFAASPITNTLKRPFEAYRNLGSGDGRSDLATQAKERLAVEKMMNQMREAENQKSSGGNTQKKEGSGPFDKGQGQQEPSADLNQRKADRSGDGVRERSRSVSGPSNRLKLDDGEAGSREIVNPPEEKLSSEKNADHQSPGNEQNKENTPSQRNQSDEKLPAGGGLPESGGQNGGRPASRTTDDLPRSVKMSLDEKARKTASQPGSRKPETNRQQKNNNEGFSPEQKAMVFGQKSGSGEASGNRSGSREVSGSRPGNRQPGPTEKKQQNPSSEVKQGVPGGSRQGNQVPNSASGKPQGGQSGSRQVRQDPGTRQQNPGTEQQKKSGGSQSEKDKVIPPPPPPPPTPPRTGGSGSPTVGPRPIPQRQNASQTTRNTGDKASQDPVIPPPPPPPSTGTGRSGSPNVGSQPIPDRPNYAGTTRESSAEPGQSDFAQPFQGREYDTPDVETQPIPDRPDYTGVTRDAGAEPGENDFTQPPRGTGYGTPNDTTRPAPESAGITPQPGGTGSGTPGASARGSSEQPGYTRESRRGSYNQPSQQTVYSDVTAQGSYTEPPPQTSYTAAPRQGNTSQPSRQTGSSGRANRPTRQTTGTTPRQTGTPGQTARTPRQSTPPSQTSRTPGQMNTPGQASRQPGQTTGTTPRQGNTTQPPRQTGTPNQTTGQTRQGNTPSQASRQPGQTTGTAPRQENYSQPLRQTYTPGQTAEPTRQSYTPGKTAEPSQPATGPEPRQSTFTQPNRQEYTADMAAGQPGQTTDPEPRQTTYTQPPRQTYTPGQSTETPRQTYTPGQTTEPSRQTYTPGQTTEPSRQTYTPGQATEPPRQVYTPSQQAYTPSEPTRQSQPTTGPAPRQTTYTQPPRQTTGSGYTQPPRQTVTPGQTAEPPRQVYTPSQQAYTPSEPTRQSQPTTGPAPRQTTYTQPPRQTTGSGYTQPPRQTYTPTQAPQPPRQTYTPSQPSQPTYTPSQTTGSGYTQPPRQTVTPGQTTEPPRQTYTQPSRQTVTPGQTSEPPQQAYTPSQPARPTEQTYTPSPASQPTRQTYTPAQPTVQTATPGPASQPPRQTVPTGPSPRTAYRRSGSVSVSDFMRQTYREMTRETEKKEE